MDQYCIFDFGGKNGYFLLFFTIPRKKYTIKKK